MPTSSQALILLNVDCSDQATHHMPRINLMKSSTERRNTNPVNQPPSADVSLYSHHQFPPSKTEYLDHSQSTIDYTQRKTTSLLSTSEIFCQHDPIPPIQKTVPATLLQKNLSSSLSGKKIIIPKPDCSTEDDHLMSKAAQFHYITNGRYFSRIPRSFTENGFYEQRSNNKNQLNLTTDGDITEVVKPVLEIRKSQQFYKPSQSLNSLRNSMTVTPHNANNYEPYSTVPFASYDTNTHQLIQRLRSLGFRPHGDWNCDNKTTANYLSSNDSSNPVLSEDDFKSNINSQDIYSFIKNQVESRNPQINIGRGLSISEELLKRQLLCKDEHGNNQENLEKLMADIKLQLRRKKTKPATVRMRKTLPKSQPLTVCFACDSNMQASHEEIKQELETQYPGIVLHSLQFDPVSLAVDNTYTKNRWVICVSNDNDFQSLVKGGVSIAGSDRIPVRPLDAVMLEEHNAYKLNQYVEEARALVSNSKNERTKESKRLKNRRIRSKMKDI